MASRCPLDRRWSVIGLALGLLAIAWPAGAAAQVTQQPPVTPQPPVFQDLPETDFLFGQPRVALGIRGSLFVPAEGSDLFAFVREQLTIDKGDFRGAAFAADVAFAVSPRIEVVGGIDLARKTVVSEYRDYVDNDLLPIEQRSQLRENSVTGSVRFALVPRGRSVGRFVWIPARVIPYAGAGGGVMFWQFEQAGDFVDFEDFQIFTDVFTADGVSPTAHVFGGTDIQVYKRLMLTFEARYVWANGTLGDDFVGFEPLDLSGFRAAAGINLVF